MNEIIRDQLNKFEEYTREGESKAKIDASPFHKKASSTTAAITDKAFTRQSSIDIKRLEFLVKSFPKYFKYKYITDKELKSIYQTRKIRFMIIDGFCSILNFIVISAFYFEVI
jgi:hypothetical protein